MTTIDAVAAMKGGAPKDDAAAIRVVVDLLADVEPQRFFVESNVDLRCDSQWRCVLRRCGADPDAYDCSRGDDYDTLRRISPVTRLDADVLVLLKLAV
jgi:hypothetical protein